MEEISFSDPKTFSLYIEKRVEETKSSYVEAIIEYCKENYLDPEDVSKLVSESLKQKLKNDFVSMNYLKRTASFNL